MQPETQNKSNHQLMNYIQHHRYQDVHTHHTTIPLPALRRSVNLPYCKLVVTQMNRLVKTMRKTKPSYWVLTYALMSLRKEYSTQPKPNSIKELKHIFYQWLLHQWLLMHPTEYSQYHQDHLQDTFDQIDQQLIDALQNRLHTQ